MAAPPPYALTVTPGGSAPLLRAVVTPFARENLHCAATVVRGRLATTGAVVQHTGTRLRSTHLLPLAPAATGTGNVTTPDVQWAAAAKDANGNWSEWSRAVAAPAATEFKTGGTNQVSVGQGLLGGADGLLEEPAVAFPHLSLGSGQGSVGRTLVGEGFYDEVRRRKWTRERSVFHCQFNDLDAGQVAVLHRFFRALNGPYKPFVFHHHDPGATRPGRYVVRFREPEVADELFAVDRSSLGFVLIEVLRNVEGMGV